MRGRPDPLRVVRHQVIDPESKARLLTGIDYLCHRQP
jgi:hypothetical protein